LLERARVALDGRYRIVEEIGRGGTSVVFRAEDLRHHRHVAVKVLHPEVTAELGRERFLREIDFVASLAHPHILPLYDSGEMDGLLFYVSPLLEGETLRDRLARDRNRMLPVDEALRIGGEILDALAYAHAHGVLHRDIKPANILMADHHAYISDFGVARALEEGGGKRLTATGIVVGTPSYMSPEQASGKPLDHRSDLYAAACVIYEMLCGEPPFASRTAQVAMTRRLTEDPGSLLPARPSVSPGVDAVIRKSLSRLPVDRYASAEEMAAALRRGTEDAAAGAPESRPATVGPRQGRLTFWEELRRRKVWSAGVMYSGAAWAAIGAADILQGQIGIDDVAMRSLIFLALAGLPVVLLLAWAFEIAPEEGVRKTGAWKVASDSDGRGWPLLSTSAKVFLAVVLAAFAVWLLVIKPLLAS
jgi:serine/threonine-protein kinase